jgi:hypothetical protein
MGKVLFSSRICGNTSDETPIFRGGSSEEHEQEPGGN